MKTLVCKGCGGRVVAEETPEVCPRCFRPASEAFGVRRAGPARGVEDLFDLEPVELAAPPQEERVAASRRGLHPVHTEELDDGDLEAVDVPDARLKAGAALQPRQQQSTVELDDDDLAAGGAAPPLPAAEPAASPRQRLKTGSVGWPADAVLDDLEARTPAAPALQPANTVELDDADLSEGDREPPPPPAASRQRLKTGPFRLPVDGVLDDPVPGTPAASVLQPVSTLELGDEDLGNGEPVLGPSRQRTITGPLRRPPPDTPEQGRDSAPAPPRAKTPRSRPRRTGELVAPPRHELAPMAVPPPRRRPRPLTSQTETLADALRARRRRRLLLAFWVGAALVAAIAGYRLLTIRRPADQPRVAPDSGAPLLLQVNVNVLDAQPEDLEPLDAAVDVSPAPDGARRVVSARRRAPDGGRASAPPRSEAGASASRERAEQAYHQGLQLLLVSQPTAAIMRFNVALKRDPDFALAYRGLGLAYEKLGRKPLAQAAYERYLLRNPRAQDAALIRKRIESLR